jgi:hypothetical protein
MLLIFRPCMLGRIKYRYVTTRHEGTGRLLLSRGHIRICSQRGLLQAHRLPLLENHRQLYLTELVLRLIDARATDNY